MSGIDRRTLIGSRGKLADLTDVTATGAAVGRSYALGKVTGGFTLAAVDGYDPSGPTYNLLPANLLKWRKKSAQVRTGAADAKLLCIGDSTTRGSGSTTPTTDSYPARLAAQLSGSAIPAGLGLIPPPTTIAGDVNADPRWTVGTGWTLDSHGFGNASCFKSSTSSGLLTLTLPQGAGIVDSYDVYYIGIGGSPAFTATATGGTATAITPGALNGIGKTTITGTAILGGTVVINPGTGVVFILGVEAWSSTTRKVRVANAGISATSTVGWTSSTSNPYGPLSAIAAYAPDLTIISLGLNDAPTPTSDAAFRANMTALVNAAKASGDVILMTFPPAMVDGNESSRQLYLAAYRDLAASLGCALVDINGRFIDYATANPLGYFGDTLHPSTLGYSDIAQALSPAVCTAADGSGRIEARAADPLSNGLIYTFDPLLATAAVSVGASPTTGRTSYYRVIGGGPISKIGLDVTTSSGNICVSAHRSIGTGPLAMPGPALATSGSVACPAGGYTEVSLGATVALQPGDWLAIAADSDVAKFRGSYDSAIVTNMWKGRAAYQNVFPSPTTPAATVGLNRAVMLLGIA